ncbi:MAG TPA: MCE family protein [Acidimicrobiales bacterium]|nr:MCE family protein [Acidimicrobiales bacterium]
MPVLLLVVTAIVATLLGACSRERTMITATFDDVGDLVARHSVQVADVRVGSVASIRLTDDFKAEVKMALDPSVRVPKDSRALIRTTSLLGEKFVELRPLGDPGAGPYLEDGDVIEDTGEAPELEFVAQEAVDVLGSVVASDVATLIDSGADAFGGRGDDLQALLADVAVIARTFASRTEEIGRIIDGLDRTTATLAAGSSELEALFVNLAGTTKVLADNRQRALNALEQLSRLARVQDDVIEKYRVDIDRQIKQVDAIVAVAAGQTAELGLLVDWLNRFIAGLPPVVPGDFTQVYGWLVPVEEDTRPQGPAGDNPPG